MQNTQKLRWTEAEVNVRLEEHMVSSHRAVMKIKETYKCSLRTAAFILGVLRVKEATDMRGIG